jgi:hypothetical protein
LCFRQASNPKLIRPWFGNLLHLRKTLKLVGQCYETSPSTIPASDRQQFLHLAAGAAARSGQYILDLIMTAAGNRLLSRPAVAADAGKRWVRFGDLLYGK